VRPCASDATHQHGWVDLERVITESPDDEGRTEQALKPRMNIFSATAPLN
jgi:hypothetical protein